MVAFLKARWKSHQQEVTNIYLKGDDEARYVARSVDSESFLVEDCNKEAKEQKRILYVAHYNALMVA